MNIGQADRPTLEPRAWPHDADEIEAADTDEYVRSIIARAIDEIALAGRTVRDVRNFRGQYVDRYQGLINALADCLHDYVGGE
jgi:hypothetical protein